MQTLTIENELTIFTASEMKTGLLAFLDTGSNLEIDLSQVVEIDTAGLQILILIKREAAKAGKSLKFAMHSKPVLEIMELANLTAVFGDQVVLAHTEE
ncbi:MAG: STAS domain-containing protein [Methylomicrobium sp.]|nr:STAS domain-containing protein [Methylomicrobium sp.]